MKTIEQILANPKLERKIKLLQARQRAKAKSGITAKERAKKTLTEYELIDALVKQGLTLKVGKMKFFNECGMGCIDYGNGKGVVNATLEDFVQAVKDECNFVLIGE